MCLLFGEVLHGATLTETVGVSGRDVKAVKGAGTLQEFFTNRHFLPQGLQELTQRMTEDNRVHFLENGFQGFLGTLLRSKAGPLVEARLCHRLGRFAVPFCLLPPVGTPFGHGWLSLPKTSRFFRIPGLLLLPL